MTPEVRERVLDDMIRRLARDLYHARCFAHPGDGGAYWSMLSKETRQLYFAEAQTLVRGEKP